jgi:hypothetical protein
MKRELIESGKVTQVSTNVAVMSTWVSAFEIEQVKFQFFNYDTKERIDIYVSFEDWMRLTEDIRSGIIFKQIEASGNSFKATMGGSARSTKYDGEPESRILTLGTSKNKKGETVVYFNATSGKATIGKTGLLMPDGAPDQKIVVGSSIKDMKNLFLYTDAMIRAYLAKFVHTLIKNDKDVREEYKQSL